MNEQDRDNYCPFCGGEPILMYQYSVKYDTIYGWVECKCCGARTRAKALHGKPEDEDFFVQFAYKSLYSLWSQRYRKE